MAHRSRRASPKPAAVAGAISGSGSGPIDGQMETYEQAEQRLAGGPPHLQLPHAATPSRHPLPKWLDAELSRPALPLSRHAFGAAMDRARHSDCGMDGAYLSRSSPLFSQKVPPGAALLLETRHATPAEWGVAEWKVYARMRYLLPHCITPLWEEGFQDLVCTLMKEPRLAKFDP